MKSFMLFGFSSILIVVLISGVASFQHKDEIPANHVEVVLRNLGHQLLLSARDSTSRVLPIKKINDHSYQLSFQNNFSFVSDSLINLVQRTFQKTELAKDYIVSLKNCKQDETVFAFEINSHAGDLTPCRGRTLEAACYIIQIDLLKKNEFNFLWFLLLILPLGLIGYFLNRAFQKKEEKTVLTDHEHYTALGKFKFYVENNLLSVDQTNILLSEKETKALVIFSQNVNQVVDREQLMKEIWEDKGVVVISRNVDVLVSKLRKKLSDDPSLKFINVHGRGYKLMID